MGGELDKVGLEKGELRLYCGHRLECRSWGKPRGDETLVLLHEGLGSVALWRDFPEALARATGRPVLAYSRLGYGRSDPYPEPRRPDFMHREALEDLPALLDDFGIERAWLVGHSDGASIALLHAGLRPERTRAVVALAPHLFVEPITLASIQKVSTDFDAGVLAKRLSPYHADPVATFRSWSSAWLDAAFADWNIEAEVAKSRCPVLALQGEDDEYGTLRQVQRIAELRAAETTVVAVPQCRHSPHRDTPERVLAEIAGKLRDWT